MLQHDQRGWVLVTDGYLYIHNGTEEVDLDEEDTKAGETANYKNLPGAG